MNIGVLTSSRADFGIYLPLLKKLKKDPYFDLQLIAFGTHCSPYHGQTIREIRDEGFKNIHTLSSLLIDDDESSIATSYGLTVIKFADYWAHNDYDLVFCLGDRFEMSAAVQAGIPFNVTFAHLHGGETTLGAIDNIYRHQITLASQLNFTSTEQYADRVRELIHSDNLIYNVGALSLDGLKDMELMDEEEFRNIYTIPEGDFILATFHPETVDAKKNKQHVNEMFEALKSLADQCTIIITMPNADTFGSLYREAIHELKIISPESIIVIENFGRRNYFSAMKYASLLLGNTSSGIIEAASFKKYVVNVGARQAGRAQNNNIIDCAWKKDSIIKSVSKARKIGSYKGKNIYLKKDTANCILNIVKQYNETL